MAAAWAAVKAMFCGHATFAKPLDPQGCARTNGQDLLVYLSVAIVVTRPANYVAPQGT